MRRRSVFFFSCVFTVVADVAVVILVFILYSTRVRFFVVIFISGEREEDPAVYRQAARGRGTLRGECVPGKQPSCPGGPFLRLLHVLLPRPCHRFGLRIE